ncbi:hypothetical protein Asp14428_22020 [Actinoplanes sp. NBRC 14428]|nr:hypothetical protein Asp14428_22020 [Actinoplanes sp. NBRC 14428]
MTDVTELTPDRLELGEGSRWIGDRLVLVDIPAGRLLAAPAPGGTTGGTPGGTPGGADGGQAALTELARLPEPLAAVAPVAGRPGAFLAAAGTGFALIEGTPYARWRARSR